MFSDAVNEMINHAHIYTEHYWQDFIYGSFTSNDCQNFADIYSDFANTPKLDFCTKWNRYFVLESPIEQWYEICVKYYTEHKQAEEYLKNLKICSCP